MKDRVKNILAKVLDISFDEVKDDISPSNFYKWDSLMHMKIVVALEEEFNIHFNDEDIFKLLNIDIIVERITYHLNKNRV